MPLFPVRPVSCSLWCPERPVAHLMRARPARFSARLLSPIGTPYSQTRIHNPTTRIVSLDSIPPHNRKEIRLSHRRISRELSDHVRTALLLGHVCHCANVPIGRPFVGRCKQTADQDAESVCA